MDTNDCQNPDSGMDRLVSSGSTGLLLLFRLQRGRPMRCSFASLSLVLGLTSPLQAGFLEPPPAPAPLASPCGQLVVRTIEEPFACPVLATVTLAEKRLSTLIFRVPRLVSTIESVYVPEVVLQKRCRTIYRAHFEPCTRKVLVPVVTCEPRHRQVYERRVRTRISERLVYVAEVVPQRQVRTLYREVCHSVPLTRMVYEPCTRIERRSRLVYEEQLVRVPRTVWGIRMVDEKVIDPVTGKERCVPKPCWETKQIVDVVKQVVPCNRVLDVPVTTYDLRPRTELREVRDYVPQCEECIVPVTIYRKEVRSCLEEVPYFVLCDRLVSVPVTRYLEESRMEMRPVYTPVQEECLVPVTTYRLEKRACTRLVDDYVPCPAEILVPVTRWTTVTMTGVRKRPVVEWVAPPQPGGCPGAIGTEGGGFVGIVGASAHAPWLGEKASVTAAPVSGPRVAAPSSSPTGPRSGGQPTSGTERAAGAGRSGADSRRSR